VKSRSDTVPFHPYYTVKDGFALVIFILLLAIFVFYAPNFLGHPDNYIPANPLQTPVHIVPEWYFLPFYAILRAIPDKLLGVIAMFSAILVLFFLPWLDTSRVRSTNYRPVYFWFYWLFIASCIGLGYLGSQTPDATFFYGLVSGTTLARLLTFYYFAHLLIVLPLLGFFETPRPLPNSISESVFGGSRGPLGGAAPPVGAAAAPQTKG